MKNPTLIWIPRVLAILLVLFMLLMSADSFSGNDTIWRKLLGFLIHNIPTLLLVLVIWQTWKRPLIAGLIFIAVGIGFGLALDTYHRWDTFLSISGVPLLAGLLFLLVHFRKPFSVKASH